MSMSCLQLVSLFPSDKNIIIPILIFKYKHTVHSVQTAGAAQESRGKAPYFCSGAPEVKHVMIETGT